MWRFLSRSPRRFFHSRSERSRLRVCQKDFKSLLFIPAFKISVAKDSEMQSFENRMLQLETKPKISISENSVQPQEDEGKSPKALPTAWITAPSQLNPDSIKYLIFQQKFQINNLVSILILCLSFFSECQWIKSYFPCLNLMNIFGFSGSTNFQGSSGATTLAASGFQFGALANLQAPSASFSAPYSSEAAYQAYVQRVLDVTATQGLLRSHEILFH